jgi:hypothetical protein
MDPTPRPVQPDPTAILLDLFSRTIVADRAQQRGLLRQCFYPNHDSAQPAARKKNRRNAASKAAFALGMLGSAVTELGGEPTAYASTPRPRPLDPALTDAQLYREIAATFDEAHRGRVRVHPGGLTPNVTRFAKLLSGTRSEALSAELTITGLFLGLTPEERGSWGHRSRLVDLAGDRSSINPRLVPWGAYPGEPPLTTRYVAEATYRPAEGGLAHVAVPVFGFWLADQRDREKDHALFARTLEHLRGEAEGAGASLTLLLPSDPRREDEP